MLRHRRLAHLDRRNDLADRQRPPLTREQIQNLQPRGIRQTPKPTRKQLRLIASNHRLSTIADSSNLPASEPQAEPRVEGSRLSYPAADTMDMAGRRFRSAAACGNCANLTWRVHCRRTCARHDLRDACAVRGVRSGERCRPRLPGEALKNHTGDPGGATRERPSHRDGPRGPRSHDSLTASAEWKSLHMAGYNYLAHDDPAPPVARTVADRLAACGYPSTGAGWGENIAYGYPDAASVMTGWLNSPGHKANLENPAWTTIGVGGHTQLVGRPLSDADFGTTGASAPRSAPPPRTRSRLPCPPASPRAPRRERRSTSAGRRRPTTSASPATTCS